MTNGQLLFYGGAALLGLTVILAIIFLIKKPKYTPESVGPGGPGTGRTQPLLNGYPTDPMTIRRDSPQQTPLMGNSEETELLPDDATELMTEIETLNSQQTELTD